MLDPAMRSGLMQAVPQPQRRRWLLPLALALAAALFGVTEVAYQDSSTMLTTLASRMAARTAIATVMRRVLDAETAHRGYLLTGRRDYLVPADAVTSDLAAAFATLEIHYRSKPALLARLAQLNARVEEKQSELAVTLRLFNAGQHERWRDLLLTDIGREKMDAVREASDVLMADEDQQVRTERDGIFGTLRSSRLGLHGLTLLSLLVLVFYVRKNSALDAARQSHARDLLTERDELERQVDRRTAELTELATHLQSAREDERSHLARELHDELGALLTAAKLDVARLRRTVGNGTPGLDERMRHLDSTIEQGISLKRRIIENLHPSSISKLGLVATLEILARDFGISANLRMVLQLEPVDLSDTAQMTVYRLVQESFTNIAKYAGATTVSVALGADGDRVRVSVRDDGGGFNTHQVAGSTHGLRGMRFRVEAAGGELRVSSAIGKGTVIEAWLPASTTNLVADA